MAVTSKSNPAALEPLDSAIAEVAQENYARLSTEFPSSQWVDSALEALRRLQNCDEPDYDLEGVNVFYLSWYQPRQIHLAYVALRQLLDRRRPPRYVVDYGCGAWAVQFALAMILAEKPELQGAGIAVHGVDSSESMKRIGKELWSKFLLKIVGERGSHFLKLHDAMKSMEDSCTYHATIEDALAAVQGSRTDGAPGDCWFTAIHAIYGNRGQRSNLENILDTTEYRSLGFALEVVTFYHPRVMFYPQEDRKSRFTRRRFSDEEPTSSWSGPLYKTYEWRMELANFRLFDLRYYHLLTSKPPTWDLKEYAVMIREKGGPGNDRF